MRSKLKVTTTDSPTVTADKITASTAGLSPRPHPDDASFYNALTWAQKREVQNLQWDLLLSKVIPRQDGIATIAWTIAIEQYRESSQDAKKLEAVIEHDDYF